ncbi:hypothetical protein HDU82_008594 [Entophlyctis luteolus]|nr:hypothetical protein HDU82_008594 [Entophlyctis luteolus]
MPQELLPASPKSGKLTEVQLDHVPDDEPIVDKFTTVRVPLGRAQFALVFLALILGILLAALDQTIVSTALKKLVNELGHEDLTSWIGSAYMMTSCMFCSLYGKFADIFGRKFTFIAAVTVFEIGSLICGLASSMAMLIVGRAVAGIGGGGIMSICLIILSDIVSIQDRGKYQGIIGGTFTLAGVLGPLVGGAFVDYVSWRWCFYLNLPIGAVTIAFVIVFLDFPKVEGTFTAKLHRVDFLGSSALAATILLLLVPIQLGGNEWAWDSWSTIFCFIAFVFMAVVFIYVEGKVAEPIIPHALFKTATVSALVLIAFMIGAAFFSAIYYNALFFQLAQGYSATDAGVQAIPFQIGASLLSILSGIIVSKTGQYKIFFFAGPIVMIIGVALMATMNQTTGLGEKIVYLFLAGVGGGAQNQMTILALQASVDSEYMAIVTSVQRTFQQLGGSIGVSIIGNILNAELNHLIDNQTQSEIDAIVPASYKVDPVNAKQRTGKSHTFAMSPDVYSRMMADLIVAIDESIRSSNNRKGEGKTVADLLQSSSASTTGVLDIVPHVDESLDVTKLDTMPWIRRFFLMKDTTIYSFVSSGLQEKCEDEFEVDASTVVLETIPLVIGLLNRERRKVWMLQANSDVVKTRWVEAILAASKNVTQKNAPDKERRPVLPMRNDSLRNDFATHPKGGFAGASNSPLSWPIGTGVDAVPTFTASASFADLRTLVHQAGSGLPSASAESDDGGYGRSPSRFGSAFNSDPRKDINSPSLTEASMLTVGIPGGGVFGSFPKTGDLADRSGSGTTSDSDIWSLFPRKSSKNTDARKGIKKKEIDVAFKAFKANGGIALDMTR